VDGKEQCAYRQEQSYCTRHECPRLAGHFVRKMTPTQNARAQKPVREAREAGRGPRWQTCAHAWTSPQSQQDTSEENLSVRLSLACSFTLSSPHSIAPATTMHTPPHNTIALCCGCFGTRSTCQSQRHMHLCAACPLPFFMLGAARARSSFGAETSAMCSNEWPHARTACAHRPVCTITMQ
jgi:hypothetical protein